MKLIAVLNPHGWAITHLSPSGLRGNIFLMMHQLFNYDQMVKAETGEETEENPQKIKIKEAILSYGSNVY